MRGVSGTESERLVGGVDAFSKSHLLRRSKSGNSPMAPTTQRQSVPLVAVTVKTSTQCTLPVTSDAPLPPLKRKPNLRFNEGAVLIL